MFEFFSGAAVLFSGNGTEQQGGCVFGAESEIGIRAFARPNGTDTVKIESEEFGSFEIEIGETEPKAEEAEKFSAIVRGVMNCFIESGNIFGGFDAKIRSEIPAESGISAAGTFSVLVGKIISGLFFEKSVPPLRLVQFGKIALENYFGKPACLSEGIISAIGGTVFMDFSEPDMPNFEKIPFDYGKTGYALALLGTGDFSEDYTEEQKNLGFVAWNMGHTFLSEADEAEFVAQFPILRQKCGERAVFRALRFYEESRRASEEFEAFLNGDFEKFLEVFRGSSEKGGENSEVFDFAEKFIGEKGAAKEFSEKVLAFVPEESAAEFAEETEKQGIGIVFLL
ncbi:MAG: hypothetical protein IKL18_01135 [Oscillospiraceae bacterium]|nr:hypothetical protein [Oscillospiraceae bacterium]